MKKNIAVQVDDLTVAYNYKPVLWDIDLEIPEGVLMAIVGPNGAGKSTLIKSILGILKPIAGSVSIFGKSYEKQRHLVAYVPQKGSVDWDFPTTALDVVTMGTYGSLGWIKRPGQKEKKRIFRSVGKSWYACF
ncbi:manganese ABC transporter ATP-binding protein SitB [Algibacter lectus]|uniref:Manganese ABC transporter ATP-binding protein SitB n=1 Tax=Algibacter lectus TaxID=221126 RepID=A0A090V759_9FLAO|nr:manganese ABC transporter ATP-binding protein SitB [Algibacter lectus]